MTTDKQPVGLMPLPDWAECMGEITQEDIRDYDRACVAQATAAKDAEIEALRAELAEARDGWHMANGTADLAMKHRDAAEARAERLAEALREIAKFDGDPRTPIYNSVSKSGIARRALLREQEEGK